ncbi:toprim domain-containing protein [Thalassobacillus sp. CUG 92003]|uniref:toprim domain-containing protein n=1 Tax=Thalassobacillus sp. CUG 92003 TaxID=2736641 RepID=UPI0015E7B511|nr:toprim domain-containing protein [Thalassobacillus sp. CUG 92003]
MPTINVAGRQVDVDIRTELENYEWGRAQWADDQLRAQSPFRPDHLPSFYVNLDGESAGTWGDRGADDPEYAKGGFVQLLAYLRGESYEETADYLLAQYLPFEFGGEETELKLPQLRMKVVREKAVLPEFFTPESSAYLANRGITPKVQRYLGVGYDGEKQAVILPWRHVDDSLANAKYRSTGDDKRFWYVKGAEPIRNVVFGLHIVYQRELSEVVITEAEIDALSWMSAGVAAIAVGSSTVSDRQLALLRKAPAERYVLCTDNDAAGEKLREQLAEGLRGYAQVADVRIPAPYKDANEAWVDGVGLAELKRVERRSFPLKTFGV